MNVSNISDTAPAGETQSIVIRRSASAEPVLTLDLLVFECTLLFVTKQE